jgi:hypothetical protein
LNPDLSFQCRATDSFTVAFTAIIECLPSASWGYTNMRVCDRYWLEHDTVAFTVLVIALGILELLVLGN